MFPLDIDERHSLRQILALDNVVTKSILLHLTVHLYRVP
jgi:hypothetical protein